MQKRSFSTEIRYAEIQLDRDFPIAGGQPYSQKDQPITFLHFHQCLEIGYCYSGSGIFVIGEKILPFQAGDVSFINHTEVHLARSAPGTSSEWTWIYLDPARLVEPAFDKIKALDPSPYGGSAFNNILSARNHPGMGRVVLDLIEELRGKKKGRREVLRALVWQFMLLIGRLAPEAESGNGSHRPDYERIGPALQYMAHEFSRQVDVGRLAKICGLSEPHFRRIFLKSVGLSPREYWHALRLRMAASLLGNSSLSVLEISQEVGFETLSSFNRLFLKQFGVSPRKWRVSEKGL